jgi:hypothetical protein
MTAARSILASSGEHRSRAIALAQRRLGAAMSSAAAGRPERSAGSVRQVLSKVNNSGLRVSGPAIGFGRYYGATGAHAPN